MLQMYNPKTDTILSRKEIALKYNTSLPDDIEEFEGWYRVYYDKAPDHNEFQVVKENPITLVDGHYRLTYTVETKPLNAIKAIRVDEVSAKFSEIEADAHVVSSLGFTIDANEKANRDIEGLIKVLTKEGGASTLFRDYNNNFQEVSLEDLETMQFEVIKNGQYIYQQKWQYLNEISNTDDIQSLIEMVIEFQNMTFGDVGYA